MRSREQLHEHRCQLGGLGAGMALPDQRQGVRGEGVESVTGLVEQGHDVVHQTQRIHEDERPALEVQRLAIASRRLSLPALQVEQALVDHGLKLTAEQRVYPVKDPTGLSHQLRGIAEWTERLLPVWIDRPVPGAEDVASEPLPSRSHDPLHRGGHRLLDRLVQAFAIGRGIVEAELGWEYVIAEIGEPCVPGGPHPEVVHLIEERCQLTLSVDIRLTGGPKGAFPNRAICAFEIWLDLG